MATPDFTTANFDYDPYGDLRVSGRVSDCGFGDADAFYASSKQNTTLTIGSVVAARFMVPMDYSLDCTNVPDPYC